MSCGVIIAAPAIILSIVLGWNLILTILAIGVPTIVYTMFGGVQAVTWTDVKQMAVVLGAMTSAVVVLAMGLPHGVSVGDALHVAGALGKLHAIDFKFDLHEKYTIWSGLIGGTFLSLSYFGCDQSQVQRYLTAKSLNQSRHSLLMSAFVKIPLQALILLTGVLVFAFFLFHRAPMLFNPLYRNEVLASSRAAEYRALDDEYNRQFELRRVAADAMAEVQHSGASADLAAHTRDAFVQADADVRNVRDRAVALVKDVSHDATYSDVNYVFPTFILTYMPMGLVGLMIAAILSAAMSASSGEMNSLATATVMDIYRRLVNRNASDATSLFVSKVATVFWGLFACGVAVYAANLGSLIEVVNKFGSMFYGSVLGVFILALGVKRANGHGAFVGLLAGLAVVFAIALSPATESVSYLWFNEIGVMATVAVGTMVSLVTPATK